MPVPEKKFRVQRANGAVIDGEVVARCTAIWWRDAAALQQAVDAFAIVYDYPEVVGNLNIQTNPQARGQFFLVRLNQFLRETIIRAEEIQAGRAQNSDLPDSEDTRLATVK